MYDFGMSIFVRGHVRCGALAAAALISFGARAGDASSGDASAPEGGTIGLDGGVEAASDGGGIVDTYIDPGCGCRTSTSSDDARGVGLVTALVVLAARRRNRSRHSLA
jgi:MYXO-CTERM domain-containing protein